MWGEFHRDQPSTNLEIDLESVLPNHQNGLKECLRKKEQESVFSLLMELTTCLKNYKNHPLLNFLLLFSFFILFRCHFQRIWPFFFQRREFRFIGFDVLGFLYKSCPFSFYFIYFFILLLSSKKMVNFKYS